MQRDKNNRDHLEKGQNQRIYIPRHQNNIIHKNDSVVHKET